MITNRKADRDLLVAQDGDEEGILKLLGMPTPAQAAALRKLLGLRKAAPLTDERRASLISVGFSQAKPPVRAGSIDLVALAATHPPGDTDTSYLTACPSRHAAPPSGGLSVE